MVDGKFATSVCCIDGRVQFPLANWIKEKYSVDYVDTITQPGINKTVAENIDIESIKKYVDITIVHHNSGLVVLSGHDSCAGNPVSKEEQISQIKEGIKVISSWNLGVEVIGLWVDDSWNVNTV